MLPSFFMQMSKEDFYAGPDRLISNLDRLLVRLAMAGRTRCLSRPLLPQLGGNALLCPTSMPVTATSTPSGGLRRIKPTAVAHLNTREESNGGASTVEEADAIIERLEHKYVNMLRLLLEFQPPN